VTVLFFFFLGIAQLAMVAIGCAIALLASLIPRARPLRGAMLRSTVTGSAGGFAGVVVAFLAVLVTGLGCKILQALRVDTTCVVVADLAPWTLLAGYLGGILAGGIIGWRIGVRSAAGPIVLDLP